VGDSLVLIGQGYQGITSYGIYPVAGIFHLPSIEMNSQLVYMSLRDAQDFVYPYRPGILSTIAIYVDDEGELPAIQQKLQTVLGKRYEVISWKVILAAMLQAITVDNMSGQVMLLILYVIAAFGIFSTVLMMTMEKRKQYAVMISIGMKRSKLITVSFLETVIITLVGIIIGLVIIIPILYYLHLNPIPITGEMAKMYLEFNIDPILPFSIKPHLFIVQTLIIFCLSMLSALYPMIYLSRFNVLNAFRH
jgi:ABC-type lipoprotein release transport system permease subunit